MSEPTKPRKADAAQQQTEIDRRAWVRYATNLETVCEPISALSADEAGCGWPAKVHNISVGGIGLTLCRRFQPGTVLLIELAAGKDEPCYVAPIRIVHATRAPDGKWLLGCAFTRKLDEEQLQALVQSSQ